MNTNDARNLICINCPMGCHLTITKNENEKSGYKVTGNSCKKGIDYAIKDLTNPTRVITSTVKIDHAYLKRLPVKTNKAIPQNLNFACMDIINSIHLEAPINMGDILVENILNTGANLVATRSMAKTENSQ